VRERRERGACSTSPTSFANKKKLYLTNQKLKLNSDYTVEFVSINPTKQDLTWIYLDLDKVTSGPYNG
jgi:hypothetical protein